MVHLVNRMFDEMRIDDSASATRTLRAGDLRAWGTVFGNQDSLTAPGESQDATGIVNATMVVLIGSALPGPGRSIHASSVRIEVPLTVGAEMTASIVVREQRDRIVVPVGCCADPAGQIVATTSLELLAPTSACAATCPSTGWTV